MHVKAKDEKAHNHTRVGSNPVMAEPFGRRRTWTKEKRMPDVCRMASHAFPREDVGSISRMIWRINKQCSGGTPQARVAIDPGQTSRDGQGTGWEDKTTKLRRHVTVGRENSFRCRSSSEGGGLRPSASTSCFLLFPGLAFLSGPSGPLGFKHPHFLPGLSSGWGPQQRRNPSDIRFSSPPV